MSAPKKLIEVAMPVKEVSAESVRDKSIRHGHISTLHLWWARRPLPVCRAVVFASLVPDPLDENCPQNFRDAVEIVLGSKNNPGDPYKPYDDIPFTSSKDAMEDNLRNRLLMFIGKYSPNYVQNLRLGKSTAPAQQLAEGSLIKWESRNQEKIITNARKLIWVAHNAESGKSGEQLLHEFDLAWDEIKKNESDLYSTVDRHIHSDIVTSKQSKLDSSIDSFLTQMPKVFDPFAGGGAIPLEAARLGCKSYGNDINPVAHIIQKGSVEYPQKFGKPIIYSKEEFVRLYGYKTLKDYCITKGLHDEAENLKIEIQNRLAFDVDYYIRKLLHIAENEVGSMYPADENGNKPVAYYWARVGTCSNPTCRAEVPLLKQFYLCNKKDKQIYLKPVVTGTSINFSIEEGVSNTESWISRGNMFCPCCKNTTDVNILKQQFINGTTTERLLAVIWESAKGKEYKLPSSKDFETMIKPLTQVVKPTEAMPVKYTQALPSCTWGLATWGDLFSKRQLTMLDAFQKAFNVIKTESQLGDRNYAQAVITYLGIFIDRVAIISTSFGVWHTGRETLERPMGRQAIPMVFDYPESNPFCNSSGSALNQLDWLVRYINEESHQPFPTELKNASSGEKEQFPARSLTAVITDPPYYDAIAYADLSDFFYVWLKRTLGDVFPMNFATPQTPKSDECTALKHHHESNVDKATHHFENKLMQIFDAIEHQTSDIVSIMFAHQSTDAWTTLCNSILGARMNITGSWANDTEMMGALKTDKAFLSSSVTVSCRPAQRIGIGAYKEVKREIEKTVTTEVEELYKLGFRGADLLTACFGQAVSEFGKYEKVEKADGSEVTVAELLDMARESAFNALLKGFDGDDFTKFYIGWLQLYGFAITDFDDAAKFSRVGLSIDVAELFSHHILIKEGNKQTLGGFLQRIGEHKKLGESKSSLLIDQVHRAMFLYKGANRGVLLSYIAEHAGTPESSFWRVLTSLCEILPAGTEDHKYAHELLVNKENLIRESLQAQKAAAPQGEIEF